MINNKYTSYVRMGLLYGASAILLLMSAGAFCEVSKYSFPINQDELRAPIARTMKSPLSSNDVVHSNGGHFYTVGADGVAGTADDKRVRFFGVNLTPPLTFPETDKQADRLASRLARLGVNLVRIHGLDHVSKQAERTIISNQRGYPYLDYKNVEGLDRLFRALERYGIYVDLNIKVSYTFESRYGCGTVESPEKCSDRSAAKRKDDTRIGKPIDLFDEEMIGQQEQYAAQLVGRYAGSPALALVEINNENSLLENADKISKEPLYYQLELEKRWKRWLKEKYTRPDRLREAWAARVDSNPFGNKAGNARWGLYQRGVDRSRERSGNRLTELPDGFMLEVSDLPKKYYYLSARRHGVTLGAGRVYELRFTADTDLLRTVRIAIQDEGKAGGGRATSSPMSVVIKPGVTEYSLCFSARSDVSDGSLIVMPFSKRGEVGQIKLTGASLEEVSSYDDLVDGSQGTDWVQLKIKRPGMGLAKKCQASADVRKDYFTFLRDIESDYYQRMLTAIRKKAGWRGPVAGTQSDYGGLLSQRTMSRIGDYSDVHAYWDHPHIDKQDNGRWWMTNQSAFSDPRMGPVRDMIKGRISGKPLVISEYGVNWLNEYSAEQLLVVAAYSSLQDIDGIVLYTYFETGGDTRRNLNPDRLLFWYNVTGNPVAESTIGIAAEIFRGSYISPANQSVLLDVCSEDAMDQMLKGPVRHTANYFEESPAYADQHGFRFSALVALQKRVAIQHKTDGTCAGLAGELGRLDESVIASDTGEIRSYAPPKDDADYFVVDTDRLKIVAGRLQKVELGGVVIGPQRVGEHGVVAVFSNDGLPIAKSDDVILISLGGGANEALSLVPRGKGVTSCVKGRDGGCKNPFWEERAGKFLLRENPVQISIERVGQPLRAYVLDETGGISKQVAIDQDDKRISLRIGGVDDASPWYQLVGIH